MLDKRVKKQQAVANSIKMTGLLFVPVLVILVFSLICINNGYTKTGYITLAVTAFLIYKLYKRIFNVSEADIKKSQSKLDKINEQYNTNFKSDMGFGRSRHLYFDVDNRKIYVDTKDINGVYDFDFIRSWQVNSTALTGMNPELLKSASGNRTYTTHENVALTINTNSLEYPVLQFPLSSIQEAETWSARLDLLMNG